LTLAAAVIACLLLSPHACAETTLEQDILFAEVDGFELYGDMYLPEGQGPHPGVLFVHGGGFVGGDKAWTGQPAFLQLLAEKGYAVFSINYRLFKDGVGFPGNIRDTKCGLAWMKANADRYGIDTGRVGVMGFSAGAYFAAMIAFTPNDPHFQPVCDGFGDADTSVDAAVMFYPPIDFTTLENSFSKILEMQMMKLAKLKTRKELAEYKKKYSPVNYIDDPPPIFLGFARHDRMVPATQQDELMARLDEAEAVYEYYEVKSEDVDHGFVLLETEEGLEARKRTADFLDRYLRDIDDAGESGGKNNE